MNPSSPRVGATSGAQPEANPATSSSCDSDLGAQSATPPPPTESFLRSSVSGLKRDTDLRKKKLAAVLYYWTTVQFAVQWWHQMIQSLLIIYLHRRSSLRTRNASNARIKNKRKRAPTIEETICEIIERSTAAITSAMQETATILARAIQDTDVNEMKLQLNNELSKIKGLNMAERHRALAIFIHDDCLTQVLFTLKDEEKEELVRSIISDKELVRSIISS